jgi:dolichol-phosphate mannosyltransferase
MTTQTLENGIHRSPSMAPVSNRKAQPTDPAVRSVSLVIPFYNEASSIAPLRKRLLPVIDALRARWALELILVEDGSADDTFKLLVDCFDTVPGVTTRILRHDCNRGIGGAMATGFGAATSDVVCTMDCDCTYAPEELSRMIDTLTANSADVVTGSPYHPNGKVENVQGWRLALSRTASRLYSFISPVKLYCYTSFFRVYRREWARPALFESQGFLGVTEVLLSAAYGGARIVEYPVRLGIRTTGQSKMKVVRVTLQHLCLLARTARLNLRISRGEMSGEQLARYGVCNIPTV